MEKTKSKLSLKHKIGYGLGDAGGCMTFALMGGFFTRYCLNVLKVDNVVLASLLFVWNVWDAVNDPLMGALMDKMFVKHHNAKGKFRPWLLRATPLLCIGAIALWTLPGRFSGVPMIAALFICKIFYEGCYTMFNIPMGSLLSAMSDTDEERAALSSARGFGSMVGNYVPMIMFPILLSKFGDSGTGYGLGATICALLGFVTCFFHYYLTEERNVSDAPSSAADNIKFSDILQVFAKNRAFLALCLHGIFICCMQSISGNVGTYMYGDVLGNIALMSMGTIVSIPLSFVTLSIAPKVAKKITLEGMIRYALLIGAALYGLLFLVMNFATIPAIAYMIWAGVASAFTGVSVLMQWGMVGTAIDYNEYLTGKRTEGSIYGTFNLCRRMGTTIGSSLAVLLLGWVGYNADAAVQTAGALTGIKSMALLIPAVFAIGSWVAFRFVWNITPAIREKMTAFKAEKENHDENQDKNQE